MLYAREIRKRNLTAHDIDIMMIAANVDKRGLSGPKCVSASAFAPECDVGKSLVRVLSNKGLTTVIHGHLPHVRMRVYGD